MEGQRFYPTIKVQEMEIKQHLPLPSSVLWPVHQRKSINTLHFPTSFYKKDDAPEMPNKSTQFFAKALEQSLPGRSELCADIVLSF